MGVTLKGGGQRVVLAGAAVFLAGLFCVPTNYAKFLMVPALVVMAGMRVLGHRVRFEPRDLRRADFVFLLFTGLWTAVTVALTHPTLTTLMVLESNVLLMVLFALAVDAVVDAGLFRPFLALLVGFAALEAVVSMALQFRSEGLFSERLFSFGRAANPIPAAGGYAVALLAALVLLRARLPAGHGRRRAAIVGAAVALVAALLWSASRGPIFSVLASLVLASLWPLRRHPARLIVLAVLVWGVIASFILFEADIKGALCHYSIGRLCAGSLRLDVWEWVAAGIRSHPWTGLGFDFRFPGDRPHAHNGLAALALGGGLPFLGAFLALCVAVSRYAADLPDDAETLFSAQAFIFAFGYMATDLPNPVGFINTHYLFLWLPVFLIASRWQRRRAEASAVTPLSLAAVE